MADAHSARFRFLHAADLHLDTPFEGRSLRTSALRERSMEASLDALDALVETALRERLLFVALAGDVYDGAQRGLRRQARVRTATKRLDAACRHFGTVTRGAYLAVEPDAQGRELLRVDRDGGRHRAESRGIALDGYDRASLPSTSARTRSRPVVAKRLGAESARRRAGQPRSGARNRGRRPAGGGRDRTPDAADDVPPRDAGPIGGEGPERAGGGASSFRRPECTDGWKPRGRARCGRRRPGLCRRTDPRHARARAGRSGTAGAIGANRHRRGRLEGCHRATQERLAGRSGADPAKRALPLGDPRRGWPFSIGWEVPLTSSLTRSTMRRP